jgi:hypothetical protein
MAVVFGTSGDDIRSGTAGADTFWLGQGGNDTAFGRAGNDVFMMGGAFGALDRINGGSGFDMVTLKGDYSAGVVFCAETMTNVEVLRLSGPFDYALTLHDANVAAGDKLVIDARKNFTGVGLVFDGSAETDGRFHIRGTHEGDDYLVGGGGDDVFSLMGLPHNDTVIGDGGDDVIKLHTPYGGLCRVDGGDGFDTVVVGMTGAIDMGDELFTGIERLEFVDFGNFSASDYLVAAGAVLEVDGGTIAGHFDFSGHDERDGSFRITGGSGYGEIYGGARNDIIVMNSHNNNYTVAGGGGADRILLNSGQDTLLYVSGDSTGVAGYDRVHDFNADEDRFWTSEVSGVAADAVFATVDKATFDADLNAASSDEIGANGAWVVQASGGDLSGHVYLCVDLNGDAAYTGGTDYVIEITGYSGTLDGADFI